MYDPVLIVDLGHEASRAGSVLKLLHRWEGFEGLLKKPSLSWSVGNTVYRRSTFFLFKRGINPGGRHGSTAALSEGHHP